MEEHRPDTKTSPDEESVFSRIMNSSVHDGGKIIPRSDQKTAILIVTSFENAGYLIQQIGNTPEKFDSMSVQEFNPDYGSPVIYFP